MVFSRFMTGVASVAVLKTAARAVHAWSEEAA